MNSLLAKEEKENSDLKLKQNSMEQAIEQLEANKAALDKQLYDARAQANRAIEAQERAELERRVADEVCDEFRAVLVKTKEAHELAMKTIHELKTTDAHKEMNEAKRKLNEALNKTFGLDV